MRKRDELVAGCMAKAREDEMTFVLLARDPAAPAAIWAWVAERARLGLNRPDDPKLLEALACARAMAEERGRAQDPGGPAGCPGREADLSGRRGPNDSGEAPDPAILDSDSGRLGIRAPDIR